MVLVGMILWLADPTWKKTNKNHEIEASKEYKWKPTSSVCHQTYQQKYKLDNKQSFVIFNRVLLWRGGVRHLVIILEEDNRGNTDKIRIVNNRN